MYPLPEWKNIFLTHVKKQNLDNLICKYPIECEKEEKTNENLFFVPCIYTHEFNVHIHGAKFDMFFNPKQFIETDTSIYIHYNNEKEYDWKQDLTNLLLNVSIEIDYLLQFKRFKILNFCLYSKHGPFYKFKIDLNWNDMTNIEKSIMFKTKIMCHNILKLNQKLKKKKKRKTKTLARQFFKK